MRWRGAKKRLLPLRPRCALRPRFCDIARPRERDRPRRAPPAGGAPPPPAPPRLQVEPNTKRRLRIGPNGGTEHGSARHAYGPQVPNDENY